MSYESKTTTATANFDTDTVDTKDAADETTMHCIGCHFGLPVLQALVRSLCFRKAVSEVTKDRPRWMGRMQRRERLEPVRLDCIAPRRLDYASDRAGLGPTRLELSGVHRGVVWWRLVGPINRPTGKAGQAEERTILAQRYRVLERGSEEESERRSSERSSTDPPRFERGANCLALNG